MLLVGQRVDCWDSGKFGKLFDVALGVSANHGAVDHSGEDPRGIFNEFAATELRVSGIEINRFASKLANSNVERNSSPG